MLNFLLMRSAFCRGVLFGRHHCHSPFSPHSPTRSLRDSEAAEEARVERCVVDIERWMTNKKLKLNENKRKLLVISSKYRSGPMVTSIQVGFETVRHQPFVRNLEVIQLDQEIA